MINDTEQNRRTSHWTWGWQSFTFMLLITCTSSSAQDAISEDLIPPSPLPASPTSSLKPSVMAHRLLQDRPLGNLTASIKPTDGELPPNMAAVRLGDAGVFFDSIDDIRPWMVINDVQWDAPATRHLPLFFEEPNLERLGYTHRCYLDFCGYETDPVLAELTQPIISGVTFVGRIAFIPYICGFRPPYEPVYTLGTDRPGSPVLYREYLPPLSIKGAIFEAGVVCGLVFGIP